MVDRAPYSVVSSSGTSVFGGPQHTPLAAVQAEEIRRQILWVIAGRVIIIFLGLNLAESAGVLSPFWQRLSFTPILNLAVLVCTGLYLTLWWTRWRLPFQLYFQMAVDLAIATLLVAHTHGTESVFVSFYLLIIIYSALIQGKEGGWLSAALSGILYSSLISAGHLELLELGTSDEMTQSLAVRISFHALGFFSVAFLGTFLCRRLNTVQAELEEKIASIQALQKLNELIIKNIRSGLITTDPEGRITLFNSTAREITESSPGMGAPVQPLIGEELWDRIREEDFLKNLRPLRHEAWILLADSKPRFLGFSVSPLMSPESSSHPGASSIMGYILSFQDLTEIKRLEEEVRLGDRMATIGKMAAGVAHEIRNPLTSMRGSAEILRSRLSLAEEDARLMGILIRQSDRLNKFVEDFMDIARPGNYPKKAIDLSPILQDTITLLENHPEVAARHRINLTLDSTPIVVDGNPDKIQQVFWNLAQNALRAMPDGGELSVEGSRKEDGAIVLFSDTGVGMTQQEQEDLFQPFQSGFQGGLGLGLSIVFQIMKDHEGRIVFESQKGRGTCVTLHFPRTSTPDRVVSERVVCDAIVREEAYVIDSTR